MVVDVDNTYKRMRTRMAIIILTTFLHSATENKTPPSPRNTVFTISIFLEVTPSPYSAL